MNRMFAIAASIFSFAGVASIAHAHEAAVDPGCADKRAAFHQKKSEREAKFDLDHDGKLSDAERAQMHEQRRKMHEQRRADVLARYDANHDGVLDEGERAPLQAQRVEKIFGRLDANSDGLLTKEEARCSGPMARRFDEIDLDKSGTLSKDEVGKAKLGHHRFGMHAWAHKKSV